MGQRRGTEGDRQSISDNANELRVSVPEQFAGTAVEALRSMWEMALLENNTRRFAINMSDLRECRPSRIYLAV